MQSKFTLALVAAMTLSVATFLPGRASNPFYIKGAAGLNVTGPVTLQTPLTAANIASGSAKREVLRASLSPNTGAAVDATTYKAMLFFGRAGIVKKITFGAIVPPAGGTCTLKALKATSSGNTMLSAATFDATTLVANTAATPTLTSTSADLAVTATQGIYLEYVGAQSVTDAQTVEAVVEFEPTDF